mmetsp:Transcript_33411/g.71196  ORF Transcript_33411/g.71196 Transcript_33411/m.71196 type:complete len:228 (-) Transcript_33411:717-1400(-)
MAWTSTRRVLMVTTRARAVQATVKVNLLVLKRMNPTKRFRRGSLYRQWRQMLGSTGTAARPSRPKLKSRPTRTMSRHPPIHPRMRVTMLTAASRAAIGPERRRPRKGGKKRKLLEGRRRSPTVPLTKLPKLPLTLSVLSPAAQTVPKCGSSTWRFICRLQTLLALAMLPTALLNESNSARKERSSMSGQHYLHWNSNMELRNRCKKPLIVLANTTIRSRSTYEFVSY